MKILIVSDAWTPQTNGVVRTLKATARELQKLGHEVELISPQQFRSIPCPTYPEIPLSLVTPRKVARQVDDFAPEALHIATEGPLGWAARRVAMQRNWAFTTAYHSRFPEYIYARCRVPVSWTYAALRNFHSASSGVLAPTSTIREELRRRGFGNTRLWSRGVDLETFTPHGERMPRGAGPIFLYVGRLAIEKNIEAFLSLALPGEKWVAGDGPAASSLKSRFPMVRWFGMVDGPRLSALYRSADVTVFPSRTDTFGLVILESLACGTPVAAFPVAGPLDVLGNSGAGSMSENLRQACLAALTMSRTTARAHAETFSWAAATSQFVSALQPIRSKQL